MQEILIQGAQLILCLSILVVLHELGHFCAARIFKTKVEKFYLFFNPKFSLFKKKIDDTEYGIGWLPLGGYVKIAGMIDESMDKEQMKKPAKPWEFRSKPAWQRLIIMAGGVIVNFILGIVIYAMIVFNNGTEELPTKNMTYGIEVNELGNKIGFQNGDKIISINNEILESFNDFKASVLLDAKTVQVERNGQIINIQIKDEHLKELIKSPNFIVPNIPYIIADIIKNSPAEKQGLQVNDQIISINGKDILGFQKINYTLRNIKNTVQLGIKRNNELINLSIIKKNVKIGIIPKSPREFLEYETKEYGFFESIPQGIYIAKKTLTGYIKQFKLIFNPETEAYKSLGGFLTIGKQFSTKWDWLKFWNFTAFLSLVLAFMNILPIPALDGGHIVFTLYEMITGKPANQKILEYAQTTGIIILVALLIFANINDIIKLF